MRLKTISGAANTRTKIFSIIAIAVFLTVTVAGVFAQDQRLQTINTRLEAARLKLDQIEGVLAAPDQRRRTLLGLREEIEPLRDEMRGFSDEIAPRLTETETRLKELGSAPADASAENAAFANERKVQGALQKELDGALRQSRLLSVRADQISDRIERQRRTLFTNRLFSRADSMIDPSLWVAAFHALPFEILSFKYLVSEWRDHVVGRAGYAGAALAILAAAAAAAFVFFLRRIIRQRLPVASPASPAEPLSRLQKTTIALRDAILNAAGAPIATLVAIETLTAFELLTGSASNLLYGFLAAVIFASAGRALAWAVLAPHNIACRLPALGDQAAKRIFWLISNTVLVTATILFINVLHRSLSAPLALTVVTSAIYSITIAGLIAYALITHSAQSDATGNEDLPPWIRLTGWAATTTIVVALLTGFIRFAAFVSDRLAMAAVVLTALYLALALIDALMGRGLAEESDRRRAVASTLGVKPKTLDLIATLVAGFLRALLFVFAAFLVVGTITTSAIDIVGTLDRVALGIEIGRTKILFVDVLAAVLILVIGFAFARIIHRWIGNSVLPRTDMEPGLQNSIATIIGYAGVIITISLALGRLGLNLENVALVAGALSVGVGFGLQAIVSNFVSGLILLTERPIRVGDWIVTKGEEGVVKKISVRSTEIETFERATVIVPNSDLITGSVKNWTHTNKNGRVIVPIAVSYKSDPQRVKEILLGIAGERSEFLKNPAPNVLFTKFGENSLNFELRGIVADVNQRLSLVSDINFEIFRRFREAGIVIQAQPLAAQPVESSPDSSDELSPLKQDSSSKQ